MPTDFSLGKGLRDKNGAKLIAKEPELYLPTIYLNYSLVYIFCRFPKLEQASLFTLGVQVLLVVGA